MRSLILIDFSHTIGEQSNPVDLVSLAASYRVANAVATTLYHRAVAFGRVVKMSGREKKSHQSAFGLRGRERAMESLRVARRALWQMTSALESGEQRAAALGDHTVARGQSLHFALPA